jgi:NADPH2:quinone reductase
MLALQCLETGTLDNLRVGEVDDPVPGHGMVGVDIKAAAVNFVDALSVLGKYQIQFPAPFIPGIDMAGVVSAVGPDCDRFVVGDRVHGMTLLGGFAERAAVPATLLRHTPNGLPFDLACTTGTTYRTAFDALTSVADLRPGEDLVILGASGAVGSAAIGVGKALGARVIACASNDEKLAFCRKLGADETIDYAATNLKDEIKRLCPNGAGVVLDVIGGDLSELALRATGYGGRFVVVGFASGTIPRVPLNIILLKGSKIVGYEIADFERRYPREAETNRDTLEGWIAEGAIQPPIEARYRLDDAADAVRRAASRTKFGITIIDNTSAS